MAVIQFFKLSTTLWVTKYRYKVLNGDVAVRLRDLVRETCEAFEIRIVKGVVSKDHVHILGELSAEHGTQRNYETNKGPYIGASCLRNFRI